MRLGIEMPLVAPPVALVLRRAHQALAVREFPALGGNDCFGQLGQGWPAATETQHEVQGRFPLDAVIRQCPAVFQLFPCKKQALLVRRGAVLRLDLRLRRSNRVGEANIKSDSFARQRLDEDLCLRSSPLRTLMLPLRLRRCSRRGRGRSKR